jgi:hypothetical protein
MSQRIIGLLELYESSRNLILNYPNPWRIRDFTCTFSSLPTLDSREANPKTEIKFFYFYCKKNIKEGLSNEAFALA